MRNATMLLTGLLALIATAGLAAAQCPECDPDGEPGADGSYSSVDVGAVTDEATALADTDLSVADQDSGKGFWAWLSFCLTVFLHEIEGVLGIHTGVEASADAYVSEHGVDLDAQVRAPAAVCGAVAEACEVTFDGSPLGDLDGATWDVMADAHEAVGDDVILEDVPVDGEAVDGLDLDACLVADLALGAC